MDLSSIEPFVEVNVLEDEPAKLDDSTLNESEGRALAIFRRAIKRRREGRPDRDWHDLDRD